MLSKAHIIRKELAGKRVLDLGGCGYGSSNAYERELHNAWGVAKERTTVDRDAHADVRMDLDTWPLSTLEKPERWDVTTAFDVLEHLEHPVGVLKWIPTPTLLVSLPNGLSCVARRMEERGKFEHLYSFTPYTASRLLEKGGWSIQRRWFTMGNWSLTAKLINALGSLWPSHTSTGMMFYCTRGE